MSLITWVKAEDCYPPHGLDMSWEHDYNKVEMLVNAFSKEGFNKDEPALVGYPLDDKIQLLSGTHRHEAALRTDIELPVVVWLRSDVEKTWGKLDDWIHVMEDISVNELECWTREDNINNSLIGRMINDQN
jgi:hypothetical protein